MKRLPKPKCKYGFTEEQIRKIMGAHLLRFQAWISGQTGAICDNRDYDHEAKEYKPSGCGPHGFIIYEHDVRRFLAGGPNLD